MAYLREEKETVEIDFSSEAVWAALPRAIKTLEWIIEEKNDETFHAKVKTKGGFMAYSSTILVDLKAVDEKTTRMMVAAETPVTTITSIADFGRTSDRVEQLFETLAKQMNPPVKKP
jgi:carbon monoxide dehydrogenase subunit G